MRYLILGNGVAGVSGAEAIRRFDAEGEVTLLSDEDCPTYSRCLIPYFMEGKVGEQDMLYRPPEYYEKNRFHLLLGQRACQVDPQRRKVKVEDGKALEYDRLLIATGGSPKIPDTPGMDKEGVFGFRTTRDLEGILRACKTARRALVSGGGCVGLMAACGLKAKGVEVAIVISSSHLLSQVADREAGEIFRRRFEAKGIPVILRASITDVKGGKSLEGVRLDNGQELDCQILVLGKGVSPNIDFLQDSGIRTATGVWVDEFLRTNVPNVYAAGDVAETLDVVTGERTVNAIWPCAAEQGRIAGANMAGQSVAYTGSMRMNSAEFFGLPLISIGVVRPPSKDYETLVRHDPARDLFRKVVLKDNVVVGVVMVGEIESAGVYRVLMQKRIDVSTIKDRLLDRDFGCHAILPLVAEHRERFSEPEWRDSLITYGG
jgi:NAD(P)H-nitrite reductase large subunit